MTEGESSWDWKSLESNGQGVCIEGEGQVFGCGCLELGGEKVNGDDAMRADQLKIL